MLELPLRTWRVTDALPSGCMCWFDPATEILKLYRLPPPDGVVGPGRDPEVAEGGESGYLDKVVSVSACETEAELDADYDQEALGPFRDQELLPF